MGWEKSSECGEKFVDVSVESEASNLLREVVAPPFPGESVKALINRAARATGLSASRVKKLWYGEARAILAVEMDAIRAKVAERQRGKESAARSEYADAFERLARVERKLAAFSSHLDG